MRTELVVSDPKPIGGEKINVHRWNTKNFRIHKMNQMVSRLVLFILECDSNNSSSTVSARDSQVINLAFNNVKIEWERAKKYRNAPSGVLETGYEIYIAQPGEIMRINNVKLQSVAQELVQLAMVSLGADSGQMQQWTGESTSADVDMQVQICQEVIAETVGTGGADDKSPIKFNVGYQAPDFRILGTLIPDVDGDVGTLSEPGQGEVQPPLVPDSPDIDPPAVSTSASK
jgi:hypothetical protein